MSTCRSCGAGIVWAVTAKGKRMPVDAEPHPDGNVTTVPNGAGRGTLLALVHPPGQQPLDADEPRYRSHFATCPQAAAHRHPRGARGG
jgi:hypothetical protein